MCRGILVVLLSLCLIDCTTMKAVERPTPSTPNQVIVGDDVRVTTKAGKMYELEITAVTDSSMTDREEGGKLWKVPFDQIETLEVRKVSAGKTAGLGLGITVVLWIAAIVAAGYAMEKALDSMFHND